MGWIVALVTIPALVMLGIMLRRLEGDRGWRDQAEACGSDWSAKDFLASDTGLRTALEAAGVEFTNGDQPGVRLRKGRPLRP